MKKTFLFLWLLSGLSMFGQIIITPNPFNINSGVITISYGSAGDYSIYDPQFDQNLYLYMGLETDNVTDTWDYHDDWNNTSSLVLLTWNDAAAAYIATFDLKTHLFVQEETGTTMTIPNNTTVNDWFFIIRNIDGSRQSDNLSSLSYGFQPSTVLNTNNFAQNTAQIFVKNKTISTNFLGTNTLEIFTINGQKIETIIFENNADWIEIPLEINLKGIYIAKISNETSQKTIKFIH